MRRALLCCALIALAAGACSSSSATYAPYSQSTFAPAPKAASDGQTAAATAGQAYHGSTPYPAFTPDSWATPQSDRGQLPSTETNPYVDTREDHLSTFGLDVDTASYTVARGAIAQGRHPDPATVRPEEWVNYFDQGYAPPETSTFAIHVDGAPTPFLRSGEVLLRVGVKGRVISAGQRTSAALTFVIDCSGSMAGEGKLEMVKQSLALLTNQMRSDDRIAIVAFSDNARVVIGPTWGSDKGAILRAISDLQPDASTNAEAGLRLGYDLARRQFNEGGINRVILATDGVANVGYTDATTILRNAGIDAASSHVQLVTVGVGMGEYNDQLLEQLADKGEGFYAHVDTLEEARRIFVDKLTTTIDTIALDAKAQIDFNPGIVAGYRLIGYENRGVADASFRSSTAKGGAIGAGHQVTALYAVVLRSSEGQDQRLATVTLRWTDPATHRATEISSDVNRGDLSRTFAQTDPHFKLDSLVAATAETLRNSPWIPGYRISDLQSAADEIRNSLPDTEEAADFLQLLNQIRNW